MLDGGNITEFARLLGVDRSTLPQSINRAPYIDGSGGGKSPAEHAGLMDEEFTWLVPFLPAEPKGNLAMSNQQVLEALIWSQGTARPLTHLPRSFGSAEAIRKRAERWAMGGVGQKLLRVIDELPLRPTVKSAIKQCATDLARRGDKIRKSRERER